MTPVSPFCDCCLGTCSPGDGLWLLVACRWVPGHRAMMESVRGGSAPPGWPQAGDPCAPCAPLPALLGARSSHGHPHRPFFPQGQSFAEPSAALGGHEALPASQNAALIKFLSVNSLIKAHRWSCKECLW